MYLNAQITLMCLNSRYPFQVCFPNVYRLINLRECLVTEGLVDNLVPMVTW